MRTIALQPTEGLVRGMKALSLASPVTVPVGKQTLGRVLNVIGEPVDNMGPVNTALRWPIHRPSPSFEDQSTELQMFETGIKVIDLLEPYLTGGKIGLFGGASVFAGVGERTREGNDLWLEFRESGVIDPKDFTKSKAALIYSPDDRVPRRAPPRRPHRPHRRRVLPRPVGQGVLLFIDNIYASPRPARSLGAARPHALRRRLPAQPRHRNGRAPGAHHLHQEGLHHFRPGHLRTSGRLAATGSAGSCGRGFRRFPATSAALPLATRRGISATEALARNSATPEDPL